MIRYVTIVVVVVLAGAIYWLAQPQKVETSPTPIETAQPQQTVAHVAAFEYPPMPKFGEDKTEVCADCHPDHVEGFKSTGMGKSLYPMTPEVMIEPWNRKDSRVVSDSSGLVYTAYRDEAGLFWQEESLPGTAYVHRVEAKLAIGSANSTRSYLGWLEGSLVQLPLTFYVDIAKWDLSPGYKTNNMRMSRPITPKCLFCHNDLSPAVPGTVATFSQPLAMGISCDRCHGDGAAHVDYRMEGGIPKAGQPDPTILNPKHLTPMRQQQVCEQCHLQGVSRRIADGATWTEYDLRQPLHDYMKIYVEQADSDEFGIASHGARLQQSKCYQESQLGCTECHNPHQKSSKDTYLTACKGCHDDGCSEPKNTNGYCPECHMPKGTPSDIPHVTFSDHYIRVVRADASNTFASAAALVDPHATLRDRSPEEAERDLAVARFDALDSPKSQHGPEARKAVADSLVEAIAGAPEDWNALDAVSLFHLDRKDYAAAATAFETMMEMRPNDHYVALELAYALAKNGEMHRAKTIIETLPASLHFRPRFGDVLAELAANDADFDVTRLEAYQSQHPPNDLIPLMLTRRAIAAGRSSKALRTVTKALEKDPIAPSVLFLAANLEFDARNYPKALDYLNRLLLADPNLDSARWLRSRCNKKLGKIAASLKDLRIVQNNQPTNLEILTDLLRTLNTAKRFKEAKTLLDSQRTRLGDKVFNQLYQRFSQSW